jgi:hypothetical protein
MKQSFGLFLIALVAVVPPMALQAQEILPVWMTTHNDNGSLLPILIKKGRTLDSAGTETGTWMTGTRTQDSYFGLRRYDENRLLLGVFSNGINENDADDNQVLATAYPDRSLIWIDAYTGKPIGIALALGLEPVVQSQAWKDGYGADVSFFLAFDISDEGYIYVACGEAILRYKPNGNNGFSGPEVVFTLNVAEQGPEDWGINTFSVRGSGKNTVITGGQNGKGFYLTTADGNAFSLNYVYQRGDWPGIGGAQSNIIHSAEFQEDYLFVSGYGNFSGGNDSSFYRFVRFDDTMPFESDTQYFTATGKPDASDPEYLANYVGGLGGHDDVPYIVVYSTPSWNTSVKDTPGFLALHLINPGPEDEKGGAYVTDLLLPVYSKEEYRLPTDTASDWFGTQGTVEVNVPEGAEPGAFEILWGGGIFGYGLFTVGDVHAPVMDWTLF